MSKFIASKRPEVADGKDCLIIGTSFKGGTIQRILEWLIFKEPMDDNIKDFMISFDAFVPVWKVANILQQLKDAYADANDKAAVQNFAKRMMSFRNSPELAEVAGEPVGSQRSPRDALRQTVMSRSAANPVPPMYTFMEVSDKVLAGQLTLLQHEIFKVIPVEEMISWPLVGNGLCAALAESDRVIYNWTIASIIDAPQPVNVAKKMIGVLEKLLALHNYNTAMVMCLAVNKANVELDKRSAQSLKKISQIVSPQNNYRASRELIATLPMKMVIFPVFDAFVGMLEFIHQEQAAYMGSSFINFKKVKLLGSLFSKISSYQEQVYPFLTPDVRVWPYLLSLQQITLESATKTAKEFMREPNHSLSISRMSIHKNMLPASNLVDLSSIEGDSSDSNNNNNDINNVEMNPLQTMKAKQQMKLLLSPRSVSQNIGEVEGENSVRNPLYNATAAKMPNKLQRDIILKAVKRLLDKTGSTGVFPQAIQDAIHASRGARGPPIGSGYVGAVEEENEEELPSLATQMKLPEMPALRKAQSEVGMKMSHIMSKIKSPRSREEDVTTSMNPLAGNQRAEEMISPRGQKHGSAPEALRLPLRRVQSGGDLSSTMLTPATPSIDSSSSEFFIPTDVASVAQWLRDRELGMYADAFADNQINGAALQQLEERDLRQMGVVKVGHRKKLLRCISDLRVAQGLSPISSPRDPENDVVVVGAEGTPLRRLAKRQEMDSELYVKGVFKGTVRLMRVPSEMTNVEMLYEKFKEEFDGKKGVILYKDVEGDTIQIEKPTDLQYAIEDSALRGGMVKLSYEV